MRAGEGTDIEWSGWLLIGGDIYDAIKKIALGSSAGSV